jgi:hypothetical protein
VIGRRRHVPEERLFECYLAEREGELIDPPVAEHLTDCSECGRRYDELTQFMNGLGNDAAAEADSVFTPDRLRVQHQQILRRLENAGHAARVITFPCGPPRHHITASASRGLLRWVAGAAAAGLFIGVGAGWFLEVGTFRTRSLAYQASVRQPLAGRSSAVWVTRPDPSEGDVAFLSELELAGDRPRTRELQALDALTPHVREISAPIR